MYAVAYFGGAAAVDLVSVMLRPLLFSGVLALTVQLPVPPATLPALACMHPVPLQPEAVPLVPASAPSPQLMAA